MVNTLDCGAQGQRFDPGQLQVFFLLYQNFGFPPLFSFHYKFYIYVNARLPFKGESKKDEKRLLKTFNVITKCPVS